MTRAWLLAAALVAATLLAALAGVRPAEAACNVNACTAADLASCCGGSTCTIDGNVTISGPDCTLDLGIKNVAVVAGGRFTVGSGNRLTIQAGGFRVTRGKLLAWGTQGSPGTPGGEIAIDASGPVVFEEGAEIDVSGGGMATGGGRFLVTTSGSITADAVTFKANGFSGSVGGEIRFAAEGPIAMSGNPLLMEATGGDGGQIVVESEADVTIGSTGRFNASVSGGDGIAGTIEVSGASLTARGTMTAEGGSGDITLTAREGALVLDREVGGLSVDAAIDQAGTIALLSEAIGSGVIRVDAPLSARGTTTDVGGGQIAIDSAATVLFSTDPQDTDTINVSGFGGGTSEVEIRGIGDVDLRGQIIGVEDPGVLLLVSSGRTIRFSGLVNATGRTGFDADGGEVELIADHDVVLARGSKIDASGVGAGDGGLIDVAAGRDVTIEGAEGGQAPANVLADAGPTGGSGGGVTITAGAPDARGVEQTGKLELKGNVSAKGTGASSEAGTVDVRGCAVKIDGTMDASASAGAGGTTSIVARKHLKVLASATVKSRIGNSIVHLTGKAPTIEKEATPPFAFTERAACTNLDEIPSGCLVPCPECDHGTVDAPWEECEPVPDGNHCTGPDFCNARCRKDEFCGPAPCQEAFCDPAGGCFRLNLQNGTSCAPGESFCDTPQECQAGICTPIANWPPPACDCHDDQDPPLCPDDDGNPCTLDRRCTEAGCVYDTVLEPPDCCTDDDQCEGPCARCENNTCVIVPDCCLTDEDCEDGNPCTKDACNETTKTCDPPEALGGPQPGCGLPDPNDRDPPMSCLVGNECVEGVCNPGTPEPCPDDGDPCTEDGTDANGCCFHEPISESCCGSDQDCPSDACTIDVTCNAEHQCEEERLTDCRLCTTDADCDPVVPGLCGTSVCREGKCEPNTPPDCTDGDILTDDSCVEENGQAVCVHTCIDERPCSDGNVCNGVEERVNCRCTTVEPPPACAGDEPCTDYGCDPATGCTAVERTGAPGVACQLGVFEGLLAGAPASAVKKGPRKKMGKLAAVVRTKTQAVTTGRNVKAKTKAAKTAQKQLTKLTKLVGKQRKLDPDTLAAMRTALEKAGSHLAGARAAIAP